MCNTWFVCLKSSEKYQHICHLFFQQMEQLPMNLVHRFIAVSIYMFKVNKKTWHNKNISIASQTKFTDQGTNKFWSSSQRPFYSCVKPLDDIITFLHHHTIALAFGSVAWPCIFLAKCDVAWKCGVKISKTKKFICKNHFSHDHRTILVLKLYSESRLAYVASICLLISRGIYSVVLLSFSVNYAYLCF